MYLLLKKVRCTSNFLSFWLISDKRFLEHHSLRNIFLLLAINPSHGLSNILWIVNWDLRVLQHWWKRSSFHFFSSNQSKKRTYIEHRTMQIFRHPLKNTKTLLLKTENFESLFTRIPKIIFSQNRNDVFSLVKIQSKNSDDWCSLLITFNSTYMSTFISGEME